MSALCQSVVHSVSTNYFDGYIVTFDFLCVCVTGALYQSFVIILKCVHCGEVYLSQRY